jgi:ABC-type sugar transport system permease subunit
MSSNENSNTGDLGLAIKQFIPPLILFIIGAVVGFFLVGNNGDDSIGSMIMKGILMGWTIGGTVLGWIKTRTWFRPKAYVDTGMDVNAFLRAVRPVIRIICAIFVGFFLMPVELIKFIIAIFRYKKSSNIVSNSSGSFSSSSSGKRTNSNSGSIQKLGPNLGEEESVSQPVILTNYKIKSIGHEAKTNRWGYFFVTPFIIVFCVFNLWPTLYTFILSFTNLEGLRTNFQFNGFVNYIKLVKDQYFWGAMGNTFVIWTFNFIPQLGLALILSIWLSDIRLNLTGKSLFRAVVYMPNLLTAVSVALLFRSIFGFNAFATSPANQFLNSFGIRATKVDPITGQLIKDAFDFFRSVAFSRGLVAFIQWWMWYGYTMIILMAGITTIPISLYESASIDGANSSQTTFYITLPLLRPIMLYILITSMIGGMQMFDIPFLLTDMMGGPNFKIRTTTVYQYNRAFFRGSTEYAYGAAISVGIFIVTIILALIIFFFLQDRSEIKKKKGGAV